MLIFRALTIDCVEFQLLAIDYAHIYVCYNDEIGATFLLGGAIHLAFSTQYDPKMGECSWDRN